MKKLYAIIIVPVFSLLTGCATVPEGESNENDPFESLNRTIYSSNSALDKALLKPVAKGYDAVMPEPFKIGISNFFANLDEIPTIVNDMLQGKFSDAANDSGRLLINTTLGLAGFIDVASDLGLQQHDEDFGQTLGVWGFNSGPYLVLPLFGPSTVREVVSMPVESYYSPKRNIDHIRTRNTFYAIELLDKRYRLLAIDSQLEDAFDEYSFVRDAYLMRTQYQVYDGNPPEEDDFYDDECLDEKDDCELDEEID